MPNPRQPDFSSSRPSDGEEGAPPPDPPARTGKAASGDEPEESAPPVRRIRRWYERKRFYLLLVVLAVIAGSFSGVWETYEDEPRWLVLRGIQMAKVPASVGDVDWQQKGALSLNDIRVGDYLRVGQLNIQWRWADLLLRGRISAVDVFQPQVWVGRLEDALERQPDERAATSGPASYTVDVLRIHDASIMIDNLGPNLPIIPITVGQGNPQELRNLPLGSWEDAPYLDQEQTLYANNLTITSPYDALSPILTIASVQLTFTLEGILKNELKEVSFTKPILYLGPDLFWFTEKFDKARDSESGEVDPWLIERFSIVHGRLGVNAFGTADVVLPFNIATDANNVRLDQLDQLTANNEVVIERQDIVYPEYQVKMLGIRGEVEFALPLTDKNADNVVPTIRFDEVSWRNVGITEAWASLTFDQKGIYGKLGGKCYGGYANGNFSVRFDGGFPWQGQIFLTGTDVGPPAAELIPSYLSISGAADGELIIEGKATTVYDTRFRFAMKEAGQMEIKSIDDLMERIPEDWQPLTRQMSLAVLRSLRTFDYDIGRITFDYGVPDSIGQLVLKGPVVNRVFTVNWHQAGAEPLPSLSTGVPKAPTETLTEAEANQRRAEEAAASAEAAREAARNSSPPAASAGSEASPQSKATGQEASTGSPASAVANPPGNR